MEIISSGENFGQHEKCKQYFGACSMQKSRDFVKNLSSNLGAIYGLKQLPPTDDHAKEIFHRFLLEQNDRIPRFLVFGQVFTSNWQNLAKIASILEWMNGDFSNSSIFGASETAIKIKARIWKKFFLCVCVK